jgi:hypothetical protein
MFDLFLMLSFSLIVLLITVSIIYSTVKLGISPMPSSNKAYIAMMQLADEAGSGPLIDLGSGWGNFVIGIAKKYPHRKIVGYELSYLPWLVSSLLKKIYGLKNLTLYRQNFYQADLSEASVLVCYLFPEAMIKITNKLQLEQSNIQFLISNNFALPKSEPLKTIKLNDFYKSPVYLYKISDVCPRSIEK